MTPEPSIAPTPSDDRTLPHDYLCAECGYATGETQLWTCPECGAEADGSSVDAWKARAADVARWRRSGPRTAAWYWGATVCVYAVSAGVLSRQLAPMVFAFVVLPCAVGMTHAAGWLWSRMARPEDRVYIAVCWHRRVWISQLPWLVAPLFGAVALGVGLIDLWAGQGGGAIYLGVVAIGLFAWMAGCLIAFVVWWKELFESFSSWTRPSGVQVIVGFLLGLAVMTCASFLGFGAGVLAAIGVGDWLGLAP